MSDNESNLSIAKLLNPVEYLKPDGYIEQACDYCNTTTGKKVSHFLIWFGAGIMAFSNPAYFIPSILVATADIINATFNSSK